MTHLGKFFERQKRENGITGKELGFRMHVDPTLISRAIKGERGGEALEIDTIIRMIAGVSQKQRVKDELVQAILLDIRDKCHGADKENILIVFAGEPTCRVQEESPREDRLSVLNKAASDGALSDNEIRKVATLIRNFRKNAPMRRAALGLADAADEFESLKKRKRRK